MVHATQRSAAGREVLNALLGCLIWPLIVSLPVVLTASEEVFPFFRQQKDKQQQEQEEGFPSPLGLSLGLLAVAVGQMFTLVYFALRRKGLLGDITPLQKEGPRQYLLSEGISSHLFQPEGFFLLGGYLTVYWMSGKMPSSYYSFQGGINWFHVFLQLLTTDFLQFIMHLLEHKLSAAFYRASHKPHHRFTNPRLFDAFDGSILDTVFMILVPLFLTSLVVDANVWSYMTFGTLYANWLVLVHAEYSHAWDKLFRAIGFGTAGDHHVHHKLFVFNFGHLFMYWDKLFGTFKSPLNVRDYVVDVFWWYDARVRNLNIFIWTFITTTSPHHKLDYLDV